jgi:hypothetical protein
MTELYEQIIKICKQSNGEALSSTLVEDLAYHDKRKHKETKIPH